MHANFASVLREEVPPHDDPRRARSTSRNCGGVDYKEDDFGWGIDEEPVHVNDFHATLLHLFGLDHLQLTYRFQGRDFRLTDVGGHVIEAALA